MNVVVGVVELINRKWNIFKVKMDCLIHVVKLRVFMVIDEKVGL